jgi:hypothetical protein
MIRLCSSLLRIAQGTQALARYEAAAWSAGSARTGLSTDPYLPILILGQSVQEVETFSIKLLRIDIPRDGVVTEFYRA